MRGKRKARLNGMVRLVWAGWQELFTDVYLFICRFSMKIGLDLVVVKMACTSRKGSDWFEELEYSWVNFIVGWIDLCS